MVKCNSCKYSSKFTNGLILCDFLKTKICVTANHTCKYGKPEEKMKNLINGQPEQDIEHCATCIHAADSEDICILRKCKYAIGELIDCYEPKQPEITRCRDCCYWIPGLITDNDCFIPPKCGKYQQMVGHSADDYCSYAELREVSE